MSIKYLRKMPGSYTERLKTVALFGNMPSTSVGAMIGETPRGNVLEPKKVTSWSDYIKHFATGVKNPFILGKVSQQAYDFFLNGGTELIVTRIDCVGNVLASTQEPIALKYGVNQKVTKVEPLVEIVFRDGFANPLVVDINTDYNFTNFVKVINKSDGSEVYGAEIQVTSEVIKDKIGDYKLIYATTDTQGTVITFEVQVSVRVPKLIFEAKEVGSWANNFEVEVMAQSYRKAKYVVNVFDVEGNKIEELKDLTDEDFVTFINENSEYVNVKGKALHTLERTVLQGGADGTPKAVDYTNCLFLYDTIEDLNLMSIPSIYEEGVQELMVSWCDTRGNVFPLVNFSPYASMEEVMEFKDKLSSFNGAIYHPWVKSLNPVTGEKEVISPIGMTMGTYARTDSTRGIWKSPAGLEATLKGAMEVTVPLTATEVGILNDYEINCIVPKKGSGIVLWGARMLKTDDDRQFVSDLRTDMFIAEAIKRNTEWAVFEPKDDRLYNKVTGSISDFLSTCWKDGMLLGNTNEEAFYVKCDSELNPDNLSPFLFIEVGYAKKKPAEFVVTKISHKRN